MFIKLGFDVISDARNSGTRWPVRELKSWPAAAPFPILKGLYHSAQHWSAGGQRGGGPTLGKRRKITINFRELFKESRGLLRISC
jgi:hypothetical protein